MPRLLKPQHIAIRLALKGCTNRPFFHIVAVPHKRPAHKCVPLEQLGTYDPLPNMYNEKLVSINFERLKHWLASGAQPSKPVEKLLGLAGFFPVHPMCYIEAERKNAKQAEAAAAAEAASSPESTASSEKQAS